jgi:glycosyltransferase involved in cell wall biosynthesis
MAEAGVYPERMRQVNHFIDSEGIEPAGDSGRSGFLYAGRLSAEKGVDVLIKAAAGSDALRVDVLGEGPEKAALERLALQVAPGRVRFLGRIGRSEVHAAMRSAIAVVVPSRWNENQPITVLEAFACGVPVIGTRLGGIPELVSDGVNGFIVPADDAAALTDRMCRLAAGPALAREMGLRARQLVTAEFTPRVHLDRLDAVYAEAGASVPEPVRV